MNHYAAAWHTDSTITLAPAAIDHDDATKMLAGVMAYYGRRWKLWPASAVKVAMPLDNMLPTHDTRPHRSWRTTGRQRS